MAVVTFMSHDGEQHEAPLEEGSSLMQVATNNAIPGIDAELDRIEAFGRDQVGLNPSRLSVSRDPPPPDNLLSFSNHHEFHTRKTRIPNLAHLVIDVRDALRPRASDWWRSTIGRMEATS